MQSGQRRLATLGMQTNYTRDPNCDTFPVPSCGYVEVCGTRGKGALRRAEAAWRRKLALAIALPTLPCIELQTGSTSYYVGGPVDLSTLKVRSSDGGGWGARRTLCSCSHTAWFCDGCMGRSTTR